MEELNALITELFDMCKCKDFSSSRALELIGQLDIRGAICDPYNPERQTSFLSQACDYSNLEMVRLLLENRANPNLILYEDMPGWQEAPFWDLQYCEYYDSFHESSEENRRISEEADDVKLEIARLFLEHGASPGLMLEGEELFSYVLDAVVMDELDSFHQFEYRSRFLILLIAYGGKNKHYQMEILKPFDKSNMKQYDFVRFSSSPYSLRSVDEVVDEHYEIVARRKRVDTQKTKEEDLICS